MRALRIGQDGDRDGNGEGLRNRQPEGVEWRLNCFKCNAKEAWLTILRRQFDIRSVPQSDLVANVRNGLKADAN